MFDGRRTVVNTPEGEVTYNPHFESDDAVTAIVELVDTEDYDQVKDMLNALEEDNGYIVRRAIERLRELNQEYCEEHRLYADRHPLARRVG